MAQGAATLARYFHAIRHLHVSQVLWRLWYRSRGARTPKLGGPGPLRKRPGAWTQSVERTSRMLAPDHFRFLNREEQVEFPQSWNDERLDKLWLYNLHYFDDLVAEGAHDRRSWHERLIARWVKDNPPVDGNGWEPYPVSLRIVNWIKWSLNGEVLSLSVLESLALQARFLRGRLEYHILANHLMANAKSLIFVGTFFDGEESAEWLRTGLALLQREIPEQVLHDGGHFELSPMYHCIVLEDLLDLINLFSAYSLDVPLHLEEAASRMTGWLQVMCHPDGDTPLFNDAAFGVAPTPQSLFRYADKLGIRVPRRAPTGMVRLDNSGYVKMSKGPAVLFCDVADIVAGYQPGHTHADTFTFELSLFGRRVLVDTGTCLYRWGDLRASQRATSAHNTISVNGENSSEVWHSFRVGRRARVTSRRFESTDRLTVEAVHDGFTRFRGVGSHKRRWTLGEGVLEIVDEVGGSGNHLVELFFQLHPDVRLVKDAGCYQLVDESGRPLARFHPDSALDITLSASHYSQEFGVLQPNTRVTAHYEGPLPVSFLNYFEWDSASR